MIALHFDHLPFSVDREPLTEDEHAGRCTFYVSCTAIEKLQKYGPRWKYHNSDLIDEAILRPCAIFRGLKRTNFADGYCYVADLKERYDNDGELVSMPDDRLFLVFAKNFMGLVVFDWEFRKRSNGNRNFPANSGDDFQECIWTR